MIDSQVDDRVALTKITVRSILRDTQTPNSSPFKLMAADGIAAGAKIGASFVGVCQRRQLSPEPLEAYRSTTF
jgi:hypothetical protein